MGNCCSFSSELCEKLCVGPLPGWVDGLARVLHGGRQVANALVRGEKLDHIADGLSFWLPDDRQRRGGSKQTIRLKGTTVVMESSDGDDRMEVRSTSKRRFAQYGTLFGRGG